MLGFTNEGRIAVSARALRDYSDVREGSDGALYDEPYVVLTDLLADLMHYCERFDIEFDECVRVANEHYNAERSESPEGVKQ